MIVEYQEIIVQTTPQTPQKEEDLGVQGSIRVNLPVKVEFLLVRIAVVQVATVEEADLRRTNRGLSTL